MEGRGEQLDLVAADTELELTAAVRADLAVGAAVVGGKEPFDGAEARGLDVDGTRWPGQGLDVLDRVDRRVPGNAAGMGLQDRPCLVVQRRIFEPCVRERLHDPAVKRRLGRV